MKPEEVRGSVSLEALRYAVDVAAGRRPGSLLLRNASLLNVFTLEVQHSHVLLAGRLIAGVGEAVEQAEADAVIDLAGAHVCPGLIDGHVHIESSLVTPAAYAAAVLPRGVTAVVCDPHEIANVAGSAGIEWLIRASEGLALDVWITVPSCVPATALETSGAAVELADMAALLDHPRVLGVAEIMSFPDVIAADKNNLAKVLLAEAFRKLPEGHAPALSGRDLQAYLSAGIRSDHEATTLAEGYEKLASGLFLMIREGSVTRNLEALLPLVEAKHGDRIGFVTDDRLPHDLIDEGGVDDLVRKAIRAGKDPVYAVRCASYNIAKHFQLPRRGAIAAGFFADLVVLDSLDDFHANHVYKQGKLVAENGSMKTFTGPVVDDRAVTNSVHLENIHAEQFKFSASPRMRCIKPIPYQVLTEEIQVECSTEGEFVSDTERDLLKLACLERHGHNGNIGLGLVHGFGLQRGALASSVGHDHHNVLAVGVDDHDLAFACQRLQALQGGFVVVQGERVLAELALPLAGLVTDQALETVRLQLDNLEKAAAELGNTLPAPFMALSFLGLEVIPALRLTDKGLVDVHKMQLVDLAINEG